MEIPKGIEFLEYFQILRKRMKNSIVISVTVFGESAGGASATYLMMSPLAKGKLQLELQMYQLK